MTDNELNNKIRSVLRLSFGWSMRATDLTILRSKLGLGSTDKEIVDVVAHYAHAQLFGSPAPADFQLAVRKAHALEVLASFARLPEKERAKVDGEPIGMGMEPPSDSFQQ